jgi:hypothetical protein
VSSDELTKALLVEEVASRRAIAESLFASVNGGVPFLQALVDSGAATPEVLARYLARTEAPFLRQVAPVFELVDRLPRGLCARLLAIPVRLDAITGTVDVVVADPADPHPPAEIGFHLSAPVRVVRAPVAAIEEGLRRIRLREREEASEPRRDGSAWGQEHVNAALRTDGYAYPPPYAARAPRRGGLVIDTDSVPPPATPVPAGRIRTPPWGTPIHAVVQTPASQPPRSGYGSEIPIPLTRKTYHPSKIRGGTERPPPLVNPAMAGLGEGYAIDPTGFRDIVERHAPRIEPAPSIAVGASLGSFIPGPPPLPGHALAQHAAQSTYSAYAPQLPFADISGVLAALRSASSRDEVLELVLTGARAVALKVALFVVKKGGYLGWIGTPEFADRATLQSVLIPLDANSIFDRAVREDLYLGPIRHDEVHAPLLRALRNPSRDVAVVPIRVSGKTAVIIVADELGDTMIATRRLEEIARAAGEAFVRIVRTRR